MSEHKFQIPQEECQYFMNMDSSIIQWSITVGKLSVDLDAAKRTLTTLYQSRATHLNDQVQKNGIEPGRVMNVKIDPSTGTLIVEVKDSEPDSGLSA